MGLTDSFQFGSESRHFSLMEQRDERLVSRLDQQKFERIPVVRDAFESRDDGTQHGATSNWITSKFNQNQGEAATTYCCRFLEYCYQRTHGPRGNWPDHALVQRMSEEDDTRTSCYE